MDPSRRLRPEDAALHADAVRALARRLVRDGGAAEDVAQEAWLVALEGARRGDVPLRWWLRGVVRNVARHFRRAEKTRRRHESAASRAEAFDAGESPVERAEIQRRIVDAALTLEEPYRTTVLARYLDGLSCAQIARRDGVPEGTVRSRLKRGLDSLRHRLDAEHAGDRRAWAGVVAPFAFPRRGRAPVLKLASGGWAAPVAAAAFVTVLVAGGWNAATAQGRASPAPSAAAARGSTSTASREREIESRRARRRNREDVASSDAKTADAVSSSTLSGLVVLADGTPVPRARVRIFRHGLEDEQRPIAEGLSDGSGAFALTTDGEPTADWRWVSAEADGLFGGAHVAMGASAKIVLRAANPCRVRVVDAVDRPIEGAAVMWVLTDGVEVSPAWRLATTNASGCAEPRIPVSVEGASEFPVVIVRKPAYRKALFFGANGWIPARVELQHARRVAGRIVDSAGRLVPGAQIACGDYATTSVDGLFSIDAVLTDDGGGVSFSVAADGYCPFAATVAAGDEDVVARLLRPRDVEVTLRRPDGSIADGAGLVLNGDWTTRGGHGVITLVGVRPGRVPLHGEFVPDGADDAPPELSAETEIDVVEGAEPLRVDLRLEPAPRSWLTVFVVDADGRPQAGFFVDPTTDSDPKPCGRVGATDTEGRLTLGFAVRPGTPIEFEASRKTEAGATRTRAVSTTTRDRSSDAPIRLVVDADARVVLCVVDDRGEPAVGVELRIDDAAATVDPENPSALLAPPGSRVRAVVTADFCVQAEVDVVAPPTGTARVPVTLPRATGFSVRVVDEKGEPASGACVMLRSSRPPFTNCACNAGPDGRAAIVGASVPVGAVRLSFARRDGGPTEATLDAELPFGRSPELGDVRLAGLAWIRGVVRDARARPVVGARIEAIASDESSTTAASSSGDGSFECAAATDSRVRLVVRLAGFATSSRIVDVGRGRDDVVVDLASDARVRVVVEAGSARGAAAATFRVVGPVGVWSVDATRIGPRSLVEGGRTICAYDLSGLPLGPTRIAVDVDGRASFVDVDAAADGTREFRVRVE